MPALAVWKSIQDGDLVTPIKALPISWLIGGLVVLLILPALYRKIRGQRYPVINPSPAWDLFDVTSMIDFVKNGFVIVNQGFQKFNGQPFVLKTDVKPKIVLGPEYIDWVNNCKDLDFISWVRAEFLTHLSCFKHFDPPGHLIEDMVRTKLTQNLSKFTIPLSDEATLAYEDLWGHSKEWQTVVLKPDLLTLIARLSAIIFTGGELAHNKEWQKVTVDITVNGFLGVVECRMFPRPVQWLVSKIMPHAIKAGTNLSRGRAMMNQIIHRRQQEVDTAVKNGEKPPQYTDAIAWLDEMVASGKYGQVDSATQQLSLAMAAIHTSTDLMTTTLYRLLAQPELMQPLREEAARVIGASGWTKQALQELRMLDSLLKETQRLQTGGALVMNRVALKDVKLPGGIVIKKGEQMAISSHLMLSGNNYENPNDFNPWRFVERRDDPKLMNKSHLVSTSVDHTGFSHGKHSCPGRFFAANEIKIALVHLLLKYDIELAPGESMKPLSFGTNISSNATTKVKIRRRQEEISL